MFPYMRAHDLGIRSGHRGQVRLAGLLADLDG